MSAKYKFFCGCEFPVIDSTPLPGINLPSLYINWDLDEGNIPLDCKATYDLLATGKTKLCFQLEKGAGRQGTKMLRPENIEHMGALGAILRPGTSTNVDEKGISTTKHFCMRKNGEEEIPSYHPVVDEVLSKTYNIIAYQESQIKLAEKVANFNKQEADELRRAVSKKKSDDMAVVKKKFLEKAKEANVVSEEQAKEIFGWIEKAARYSFNKSLCPKTLCQTRSGNKTLEEVEIGEEINSPYGFVNILNKFDHGKQEIYNVVFESGKNIKCTMEHKFLCENNKVLPLKDIINSKVKVNTTETYLEKITKVKSLGVHQTVDIEVDNPNHIYYANGIATSNSHAISYGIIGYHCAYAKTHFPLVAYTSWLRDSQNKQDSYNEVRELVDDARTTGYEIYPPNCVDMRINFYPHEQTIKFGLSNLRGVSETTARDFVRYLKDKELELEKPIKDWTWFQFLILAYDKINKTFMEALILSGGVSHWGLSRAKAFNDFEKLSELNPKEIEYLTAHHTDFPCLLDALRHLIEINKAARYKTQTKKNIGQIPVNNQKRIEVLDGLVQILENPIRPLVDSPIDIANNEERILGVAITCSIADGKPGNRWNATCCDCIDGNIPNFVILKVKVDEVKEWTISKGKEENIGKVMAFLKVSDGTCSLDDISCFADIYEDNRAMLAPGRVLEVQLDKNPKTRKLSIKRIWAL